MSLKKTKISSAIIIFILCIIFHYIYSWFPNKLFSIFFPVNESIWEHMKLIMSSILFNSFLEYFLLKKNNIPFNNYITSIFLSGTLGIIIFLIIYLPLYYLFGENFILNIIILFITICLCEIISYYILKSKKQYFIDYISLLGLILVYIVFGILTYYPVINDLFYDKSKEKYGINTFNI